MQQIDFLIIGQGLAGSLLAWELCQRGQSFCLIDNDQPNASKVAAGLVNPITGMRLVKNQHADELLKAARACYTQLEEYFGEKFFIEKTLLRILKNNDELQLAEKRLLQENYVPYLNNIISGYPELSSNAGLLSQKQTGFLNTTALLYCLKKHFIEKDCFATAVFDYTDLHLDESIVWQNKKFRYVVFCEGYRLINNPFFNCLPLKPVKGEMLTIKKTDAPAVLNEYIMNYGHWLIPLGNGLFRSGATFDRDVIDNESTEQAREELLGSMVENLPDMEQAEVTEQQAGVRPASADREPLIGRHSKYSQLAVFNGFGTKGSLQIPYYAKKLADHLLDNAPLPTHVSIQRFNEK